jgi:DNA-binding response OmpR family regulator
MRPSGTCEMIARISYESVDTLIYDPVAPNRAATRSALLTLGFRRIETVASIDALSDHLQRRPPDLAICEVAAAQDPLCEVIQELRQGVSAYNPFLVVIVTAWGKAGSLVGNVINSGADDLLLRPFSTATLEARIRTQVERRKGFVITSDYVGPDRRRSSHRAGPSELLLPPNSLKMKAKERIADEVVAERLNRELKVARATLTSERLRREAFQICVLWRLMQGGTPQAKTHYEVDLIRLAEVTKSLSRRARDTEFEEATDWCDKVLGAIEGLQLGVDRNASMHLLGHAALSLIRLIAPEKSAEEHLNELDATVAMIRSREALAS